MVLVLLVIGWAVVLLPAALRRHAERRSGDSIGAFRDRLSRLPHHGSTGSRGVVRPVHARPSALGSTVLHQSAARHGDLAVARARSRRAKKRRRDVLAGLLAAMVGSALLALLPGLSALWLLHVVLDVLFVAYVLLLVRLRNGALPIRSGVQPLRTAAHDDRGGYGPFADDDGFDYELAWSHAANE